MDTREGDRPSIRPVTQFLQEQRRGGLHEELGEKIAETVQAVSEHGKVGSVTLTLKFKPAGDGMVQVFDEIRAKVPEGEKAPSIFFTDKHGNVTRTDPRQTELPLRQVPRAAAAGGGADA